MSKPPALPPRPSPVPPAISVDVAPLEEEAIPVLPALPSISAPVISIAPHVESGAHMISLAPGTKLENVPAPVAAATIGQQLANLSPDIVAIVGFLYWGARGIVPPAGAAGFITALVVARMQPARIGASGVETVVRGTVSVLLRMVGVRPNVDGGGGGAPK